jgi:hypothetical protein
MTCGITGSSHAAIVATLAAHQRLAIAILKHHGSLSRGRGTWWKVPNKPRSRAIGDGTIGGLDRAGIVTITTSVKRGNSYARLTPLGHTIARALP